MHYNNPYSLATSMVYASAPLSTDHDMMPSHAESMCDPRRTKVLCTLGPSSSSLDVIRRMVHAGGNAFRLNFSHGSHEEHAQRLANIRTVESEVQRPISVLVDLQGPKLRVGTVSDSVVSLNAGQNFTFHRSYGEGNQHNILLDHQEVFDAAKVDQIILIDDGKIRMRVCGVTPESIVCEVLNSGKLHNRKGVSVPDAVLSLDVLTAKDRIDLDFALTLDINWVALSFVQTADDIIAARKLIPEHVGIVAKIERPAAIGNITSIIEQADAIMVARGDLGVEAGVARVPLLQKQIVHACRLQGKPVIVATHMLESMISSPAPTRAEASDIATAVYDGADAVMLSAESAAGQYPLTAVEVMVNGIVEAEKYQLYYTSLADSLDKQRDINDSDAIARSACHLAEHRDCAAVVCFTETGSTAVRVSRFRPSTRILAVSPHMNTLQRLSLVWGLECIYVDNPLIAENILAGDAVDLPSLGWGLNYQDRIVCTAGTPLGIKGTTNMIRVCRVQVQPE